jgi:hypothetical protein
MTKEEALSEFLQEISQNIPTNAVELRACSDSIISKWINLKFEYPHQLIDNFVYIESSIERIIYEYTSKPIKLDSKCRESYDFHISSFIASLAELQAFIEGHR